MIRGSNEKLRNGDTVIIDGRRPTVIRIRRRRDRRLSPRSNLVSLLREYADQAQRNFATEAILFAIVVIAAIAWPAFHTVQLLAEIW